MKYMMHAEKLAQAALAALAWSERNECCLQAEPDKCPQTNEAKPA